MSEQDCPNCRVLSAETRQQIATALGAREVRAGFAIDYLADMIGAWYADETYSAIRLSHRREREGIDTDWLIMALRKAPRRVIHPGQMTEFEDY